MTTPKPTTQSTKQLARRKKTVLITTASILLLALLIDIFLTGYLKYSYNYIKCGNVPVVATPNPFVSEENRIYILPGDSTYRTHGSSKYYCSEDEARKEGLLPHPLSDKGYQE